MKNPESTQPIWTVSHPLSFMRTGAATAMLMRSARLMTIARKPSRATSIRFGQGKRRIKPPLATCSRMCRTCILRNHQSVNLRSARMQVWRIRHAPRHTALNSTEYQIGKHSVASKEFTNASSATIPCQAQRLWRKFLTDRRRETHCHRFLLI